MPLCLANQGMSVEVILASQIQIQICVSDPDPDLEILATPSSCQSLPLDIEYPKMLAQLASNVLASTKHLSAIINSL